MRTRVPCTRMSWSCSAVFEQARAQYLEVLRRAPTIGAAWWGLANIKTVRLSDGEIGQLEAMMREPLAREGDRLAMGCVLAKAYEDHGRHAEAFAILTETNTRISRRRPWNAAKFRQLVDVTLAEFEKPHAQSDDPRLGEEIIFIVSLPRSGSTLTEQILSAHSKVEGASELGDLSACAAGGIGTPRRRFPVLDRPGNAAGLEPTGAPLPCAYRTLAHPASALDRQDAEQLAFCRRHHGDASGRAHRQLPARSSRDLLVLLQADVLDQQRVQLRPRLSGALLQDYDHAMHQWHRQQPGHIRDQVYEQLLADPEAQVRALLDYCGLPFEQTCLRFHEVERSVRTASAAQVREPLRRNTARSAGYGAALDPLRAAIAAPRTS